MVEWGLGTRFRLFPQMSMLAGFGEPETIEVSLPPGSIGPGPSDQVMYVVDAADKPQPYEGDYGPPYRGPALLPARPDPEGHFDRIPVTDRAFLSAHMYGSTRFVLDIWEGYLGRPIWWYDRRSGLQVELVPEIDWDNAHAGVGFIETGGRVNDEGIYQSFAMNFDVLAHEVGHTILFSELGLPSLDGLTADFLAYHESASDLIALISVLHFDSVLGYLIRQTGGNLYVLNWLNRIGELSDTEQIRIASNDVRLRDVAGIGLTENGEWYDPAGQGRKGHELSQPLTGAVFDILVEVYQDGLVHRGLIDPDHDVRNWTRQSVEASFDRLQTEASRAVEQNLGGFVDALREARDIIGRILALTWLRMTPQNLTLDQIAAAFLESAELLGQGHNMQAFAEDLAARDFDVAGGLAARRAQNPPPPQRSASYAERVAWVQRERITGTGTAVRAAAGQGSFEEVYRMINHDFRL